MDLPRRPLPRPTLLLAGGDRKAHLRRLRNLARAQGVGRPGRDDGFCADWQRIVCWVVALNGCFANMVTRMCLRCVVGIV